MKEILEEIKDFFEGIYYNIRAFFHSSRRFFYWGWKLRHSYEFDCHGFYEMTALKLRTCHKYFSTKGHCVWNSNPSDKNMRRILVAANLAERLHGDHTSYLSKSVEEHQNKWGEPERIWKDAGKNLTSLTFKYPNVKSKRDEEICRKDYRRIMKKYDKIRRDDKKLLFKLLEHNLDHWWD